MTAFFVNAGEANCSFQLPKAFLAGPILTIKFKLTGDRNDIPPSPKDILTRNSYFPFGFWFGFAATTEIKEVTVIGGNNCQPTQR